MIAPKGPGHNRVAGSNQNGQGVPALFAIHQDATGQAPRLAMPCQGRSAAPAPASFENQISRKKPKPSLLVSRRALAEA